MLAIYERYYDLVHRARSNDELLAVLNRAAGEFGFADAFLVEYEQPGESRGLVLDSNPRRHGWWTEFHRRGFADMPPALQRRLESEPLLSLGPDRLALHPEDVQAAMKKHQVVDLTLVPIRSGGVIVGSVGFGGHAPVDPQQSTALQLIAINVFSQMRALRHLAFKPSPAALTAREKEVLGLSAAGLTSQQIADRLGMSPRTVNQHVDNVADKLGTRNRAHTVAEVIRHGLLN